MKKILVIILTILSTIFLFNNYSNALSVADFSPALDKKVAKMKTTEEKVKFLQSFSDLLNDPVFTKDKNAKLFADIRDYSLNMLKVFEAELAQEQSKKSSNNQTTSSKTTVNTQKISKSDLPHLSDNFSNINEQKVRDTVLSWHNDERNNVGVNAYVYSLDLE